jgi:hypothetical protein
MSMSAATDDSRLSSILALLARKENAPVLKTSLKCLRRTTLGVATAVLASQAVAGDHLFHRRQTAATTSAAMKQAVVTVPVQVGPAPAVQVVPLSPSYVPVVQVPLAYTTTKTQGPVLNIKLEAPIPQAGAAPAPQAPSTATPVLVPAAAVPVPLYVVPKKTHAGLFKHRQRLGGN